MNLKVVFHSDRIEFERYPFSPASVSKNPVLRPQQIRTARPSRMPPELQLKTGEIIFVPADHRPELRVFCNQHSIPEVEGTDIWSWVNEPYLDTEPTAGAYTDRLLHDAGLDAKEVAAIRKKIAKTMLAYNTLLWEWVHLGHADLLTAFKNSWRRLFYSYDRFYKWSMEIANRNADLLKPYQRYPSEPEFLSEKAQLSFRSDVDLKPVSFAGDVSEYLSDVNLNAIDLAERLGEKLVERYSEPHRAYHNLRHVLDVTETISCLCGRLDVGKETKNILLIAGWFHDFIYDPPASDNEAKSAAALRALVPDYPSVTEPAGKLIEVTARHLEASTLEEKIIADADLATLGSDLENYKWYAEGIRAEYKHKSDEQFREGRVRFLSQVKDVAKKGKLFHFLDPIFHERAVANVEWELNRLKSEK